MFMSSVVKVMDLYFSYCYCYCKEFVMKGTKVLNLAAVSKLFINAMPA